MAFALIVIVPNTDGVETAAVEALKAAVDQDHNFAGKLADSLVGKVECDKLENAELGPELRVAVNLPDGATSIDLDEAAIKTAIEGYLSNV